MDGELISETLDNILEGYLGQNLSDVRSVLEEAFQGKSLKSKKPELIQALLLTCSSFSAAIQREGISIVGPASEVSAASEEEEVPNNVETKAPSETVSEDNCIEFKKGKCKKKGKECTAGKHPKICFKHLKKGKCDRGRECAFSHVYICPTSYKQGFCYTKNCKYAFHLHGTRRKREQEGTNNSNYSSQKHGKMLDNNGYNKVQNSNEGRSRTYQDQSEGQTRGSSFLDHSTLSKEVVEMRHVLSSIVQAIDPIMKSLNSPNQTVSTPFTAYPWLEAMLKKN